MEQIKKDNVPVRIKFLTPFFKHFLLSSQLPATPKGKKRRKATILLGFNCKYEI